MKYFGTDGIRGIANIELSAILACRTGLAAAIVLSKAKSRRITALIGRDTRVSGDMLEAALSAGLCAGGVHVVLLGVVPTPAVAYLTRKTNADIGIVVSASHNSYEHNGIKIFNNDGFKLSDEIEEEIEYYIDNPQELSAFAKSFGNVGTITNSQHMGEKQYVEYLMSRFEGAPEGIRIAVDCANGAAYRTARLLFSRLNIDAEIICDEPDGININDNCGSTHLDKLRELVISGGYDIGFAFDGDADRLLIVDEKGGDIDGDTVLAVCAKDMKSRGKLTGNTVVGTVMTNSGFLPFASGQNIRLLTADVGDKNVLELMKREKAVLGGETSGHTIFLDDATTGDGELTALKFLAALSRSGKTASQLSETFMRFPQVIVNVSVPRDEKANKMKSEKMLRALDEVKREIAGNGRAFVRPSGTEALIRVTVEAETKEKAADLAEKVAAAIR